MEKAAGDGGLGTGPRFPLGRRALGVSGSSIKEQSKKMQGKTAPA